MIRIINNLRLFFFLLSWLGALASIIFFDVNNLIIDIGVCSFGLFFIFTLPFLKRESFVIVLILFILANILFQEVPSFEEIFNAGKFTIIFAGLIPTMGLVKSAANRMSSVQETQLSLSKLPATVTSSGFQITGHVFGSVINTGVFAMLAASLPKNSDFKYRKLAAEASIRGMASSAIWSPFFVAFAVGQVYVDSINSWLGLSLGIFISIIFTICSIYFVDTKTNFSKLRLSLLCLAPVGIKLLIIFLIVIGVSLLFKLTALSTVIIVMPLLVFFQFISKTSEFANIKNETILSMRNNVDDVVIISFAMFIGYFVTQSDSTIISNWSFELLFFHKSLVLIFIPTVMAITSFIGIHPVISSTVLLSVFTGETFDLNQALIMQAHLIGWCSGTMSSIASLSVITCSNLYDIPSHKIAFGINIYIVLLFSIIGGSILSLLSLIF